ncbi:Cysteine-rich receptor-like protein kinase 2 [Senna tora]|uniref:Cysteine-rich receptor-like protein kinase 2 n=1 Tax=Senna tora TaxID=362788 RepID=A0A834TZ03_9FABA|nr:Cysteine-rich receptor-like protein kinase 2 [Senna tora]
MHLELVDNSLDPNDYDAAEVKKVIEIGLLCTQATAAMRPTMSEVVVLLKSKGLVEQMQRPSMPVFVETNIRSRGDTSTSTASSTSNATASTSILSAR